MIAAFLHDWGGYPQWKIDGMDHALRSTIVAEKYLKDLNCDVEIQNNVLDCIKNHHNGNNDKSTEAKLFSDADGLDFLGIVGILRDFSTKDREMKNSIISVKNRIEKIPSILFFNSSKELAKKKIQDMYNMLNLFEEESFGLY